MVVYALTVSFFFFLSLFSLLLLSGNFHHTRLHTHNTLQVPMADKQDNKKKSGNPLTTIFSLFLFLFLFLTTLFLTNQIKSTNPDNPDNPDNQVLLLLQHQKGKYSTKESIRKLIFTTKCRQDILLTLTSFPSYSSSFNQYQDNSNNKYYY